MSPEGSIAQAVRGRVKAGRFAAGTGGGRRILDVAVRRGLAWASNGRGLSSVSII